MAPSIGTSFLLLIQLLVMYSKWSYMNYVI